jgi:hypothetical protein
MESHKAGLSTLPTLFGNPFGIPTFLRPLRPVRYLETIVKTSPRPNLNPYQRKGLVTDAPGPRCNGCSGTLTPLAYFALALQNRPKTCVTETWNAYGSSALVLRTQFASALMLTHDIISCKKAVLF